MFSLDVVVRVVSSLVVMEVDIIAVVAGIVTGAVALVDVPEVIA